MALMPRAASAPSIALLLAALVCAALAQGDGSACSAAYDGITVSETIIDSSLAGVVQLGPNGDVRILSSLRSSRWALLLVTTSIKISRGVSMSPPDPDAHSSAVHRTNQRPRHGVRQPGPRPDVREGAHHRCCVSIRILRVGRCKRGDASGLIVR